MMYKLKNLTYQPIRIFIDTSEVLVKARDTITVNKVTTQMQNLVNKKFLQLKVIPA